ncbi:hypothetical protein lerEdw1_013160 [Lerista edwardsae]|nr:hypothetical protein lerEdw1_013160 [Lerista edwardsae]
MISWMDQREEPRGLEQGLEEKESESPRDAHTDDGTTSENEDWEEEEATTAADHPDPEDPPVAPSPVLDWEEACGALQGSGGSGSDDVPRRDDAAVRKPFPIETNSLFVICAILFHVVSPAPKCSLSATVAQTFNLARHVRANSTVLLNTYLRHQGTPFSDPGFSAQRLHYEGVPAAAMPFLEWRTLSDSKRLEKNYEAYFALSEFLQLVRDDQSELNPDEEELLELLSLTQLQIQGLLSNLTCIMTAMGVPIAARGDPLTLETAGVNTFEKKVRGYVVCYTYKEWIDRTVRDFSLLAKKFPVS